MLPVIGRSATEVVLVGPSITLDDAVFTGCFHDAFEGQVEMQADGTWKKGKQGVFRTKGVLFGSDTVYGAMSCTFTLDPAPAGPVTLTLNGVDDPAAWSNALSVTVNGQALAGTVAFPDSREAANTRYLVGWSDRSLTIPAGLLKAGANTLTIANTRPVRTSDAWTFTIVDFARLTFAATVRATVAVDHHPIYYYGLDQGPEVNLWPAINVGDTVTLIEGAEIQYKFFVTLPDALTAQRRDTKAGLPLILVNILADADIAITPLGKETVPLVGRKTPEGTLYQAEVGRLISGATPHEGQGINVFLKANGSFSGKTLRTWCSIGGTNHLARSFPLQAASLPPLKDRDKLDMLLSIWGGGIPDEPDRARDYIDMIGKAGFNHMFTGAGAPANALLKEAGFKVYPRFGWFGGGYKVADATQPWAAIGPDGKPSDRDLCPIAILDNGEHPEAGRYFARAREAAKSPGIDGLCVDYECGAVWCWCDRCIRKFQEETGETAAVRADLGPEGRLGNPFREAGRRRNRDLLAKLRGIMREVNPDLRYFSLASASDMPAYWWDGRASGRFSIREMVKFADDIACSGYFYEIPGGLKSVRPLINFARQAALASERDVRAGILSPIGTTVNENPRYRGVFMKPDLTRLEVLLTAAAGGRQLSFFRGDCFDGAHYVAIRQAVDELLTLRPFLQSGLDRSTDLDVRVVDVPPHKLALSVSHNLMWRTAWHPDIWYQYDAIQLLKDVLAKERLLLLFNYADVPLKLSVKVGGLFDASFRLTDFKTGKALGAFERLQLESGAFTPEVPARDVLMVRIEPDTVAAGDAE